MMPVIDVDTQTLSIDRKFRLFYDEFQSEKHFENERNSNDNTGIRCFASRMVAFHCYVVGETLKYTIVVEHVVNYSTYQCCEF